MGYTAYQIERHLYDADIIHMVDIAEKTHRILNIWIEEVMIISEKITEVSRNLLQRRTI